VLLLDEATSALDVASERVVQESIDALQRMKAQTTIVIAHRLSTIRNADKICLIDQGRVAEMGTHDELIALNGLYADMVRLQLNADATDAADPLTQQDHSESGDGEHQIDVLGCESCSTNDLDCECEREYDTPHTALGTDTPPEPSTPPQSECPAGADVSAVPPTLTQEESKLIATRVWAMVMRYPGWVALS
jgi:ABC-type multidrug transport system ATPase subunit